MCAGEELMSLYKIRERESTMTVGGSFTLDSGKIFLLCWVQVLLLIIEGCFVEKGLSISIILKMKFFRFSLFYAISNNPTACNSQVVWPAPSFWPLKSLLFWLKYWDISFLLQRRCIFWGFKEAKKNILIFLDRMLAVFSMLKTGKYEQTGLPFYPFLLPNVAFGSFSKWSTLQDIQR